MAAKDKIDKLRKQNCLSSSEIVRLVSEDSKLTLTKSQREIVKKVFANSQNTFNLGLFLAKSAIRSASNQTSDSSVSKHDPELDEDSTSDEFSEEENTTGDEINLGQHIVLSPAISKYFDALLRANSSILDLTSVLLKSTKNDNGEKTVGDIYDQISKEEFVETGESDSSEN